MIVLKALQFEILRDVEASGLKKIALHRQPVRLATLLDEMAFHKENLLIHNQTVFLEDRFHDWDWRDGEFRYYTRVATRADVVIVYEETRIALNVGGGVTKEVTRGRQS